MFAYPNPTDWHVSVNNIGLPEAINFYSEKLNIEASIPAGRNFHPRTKIVKCFSTSGTNYFYI
jgi:hypothetical protein